MSPKDYVSLAVGGVGLTVALFKFAKFLLSRRDKKVVEEAQKKAIGEDRKYIFRVINSNYLALNRLCRIVKADRITLLEASFEGPALSKQSNVISTVIYEVILQDMPLATPNWKGVNVDEPYVEMLLRVYEDGETTLVFNDMPESTLKDSYAASGVFMSRVFSVLKKPKKFYYLSMNYAEPKIFDDGFRDHVRVTIQEVRTNIERTEKWISKP